MSLASPLLDVAPGWSQGCTKAKIMWIVNRYYKWMVQKSINIKFILWVYCELSFSFPLMCAFYCCLFACHWLFFLLPSKMCFSSYSRIGSLLVCFWLSWPPRARWELSLPCYVIPKSHESNVSFRLFTRNWKHNKTVCKNCSLLCVLIFFTTIWNEVEGKGERERVATLDWIFCKCAQIYF